MKKINTPVRIGLSKLNFGNTSQRKIPITYFLLEKDK